MLISTFIVNSPMTFVQSCPATDNTKHFVNKIKIVLYETYFHFTMSLDNFGFKSRILQGYKKQNWIASSDWIDHSTNVQSFKLSVVVSLPVSRGRVKKNLSQIIFYCSWLHLVKDVIQVEWVLRIFSCQYSSRFYRIQFHYIVATI